MLVAALRVDVEDESPELNARKAKGYRGVAAHCKYLAQDKADM